MTTMQIEYSKAVEQRRHNIAQETLGVGELAVKAKEADIKQQEANIKQQEANTHKLTLEETIRSNKVNEYLRGEELNEAIRSHLTNEAETMRNHQVTEAEIKRHNMVSEELIRQENEYKMITSQLSSFSTIKAAQINAMSASEASHYATDVKAKLDQQRIALDAAFKAAENKLNQERNVWTGLKTTAEIRKIDADIANNRKNLELAKQRVAQEDEKIQIEWGKLEAQVQQAEASLQQAEAAAKNAKTNSDRLKMDMEVNRQKLKLEEKRNELTEYANKTARKKIGADTNGNILKAVTSLLGTAATYAVAAL